MIYTADTPFTIGTMVARGDTITVKAIAAKEGSSYSQVAADFTKRLIATILVEAGSFSTTGTGTHNVTLTKDYYMGTTEVTQAQYLAVMGTNPSYHQSKTGWENRPVDNVSWYDAVEFCNELSIDENLTPYYIIGNDGITVTNVNGMGYRLPTEAEWEYAARGGQNTQTHSFEYAGTNEESELGNYAWYSGNSDGGTQEVGKKKANSLGLYDMSGNAWEWCWDTYPSAGTDPTNGWSGSIHAIRGGGHSYNVSGCGVAYRFNISPYGDVNTGFRVVRSSFLP